MLELNTNQQIAEAYFVYKQLEKALDKKELPPGTYPVGNRQITTNIQWDTDGMTVEDCNLPTTVLVIGLTVDSFLLDRIGLRHLTNDALELVSTGLSEAFGFCHQGFNEEIFELQHHQGFTCEHLGVLRIVENL